ncbi:hypothetical protein [Pseudalkalibacillus salsuginis]|uniref:hypothetical protein n=1 Tax=Pseudalkalibacillus salsuginis TaxID=2910972 RepID=UPI001F17B596|nr:hypothetical protein [Pseudalkalibacillus salsuginis]MCF6408202.1 hypothetical protein [Pseudalkalibacillus salsuginis]
MKKTFYILGALLFITTALGISYYYYVFNDHGKSQKKSVALAKEQFNITEVNEIEHYNGSHGAFDVIRAKIDKEDSYVFIPLSKENEAKVIKAEDGWNVQKVKQYIQQELDLDNLISIRLGLERYRETSPFTPVWEIVYKKGATRYTFHYIRYSDGTFFKTYTMNQRL